MFPEINHIDDVLRAISGFEEFIVAKKATHTTIDYVFQTGDTFKDDGTPEGKVKANLRRECRGLKFNLDGSLLARPYHKFFNVGETQGTLISNLDFSNVWIGEKLDGSMVHPALINNEVIYMTMMGNTPIAIDAQNHVQDMPEYKNLFFTLRNMGYMPLFEWCSPKNQIVIKYTTESLVLTDIRHQRLGHYMPYNELKEICEEHGVLYVDRQKMDSVFDDWYTAAKALIGMEGYILTWEGGLQAEVKAKVKADAYVSLHRAKDSLMRETHVLEIVLNKHEDDLIAKLEEHDAELVREYTNDVRHGMLEYAKMIDEKFIALSENSTLPKKEFAQRIKDEEPIIRAFLFARFDGKNSLDTVNKFLKKKALSSTVVEEIRPLIGGVKWEYFVNA